MRGEETDKKTARNSPKHAISSENNSLFLGMVPSRSLDPSLGGRGTLSTPNLSPSTKPSGSALRLPQNLCSTSNCTVAFGLEELNPQELRFRAATTEIKIFQAVIFLPLPMGDIPP